LCFREQVQDLSHQVRHLTLRNFDLDLMPTQFLFRNLSRSVETLELTEWRHCYCAALHFTSSRSLKKIKLNVDDASSCNVLNCTITKLCEDKRRKNLVREIFSVVDKSTREPPIAAAEVSPCELLF
jgi:hypothetical protein